VLFLCGWYPSKVLPTNGDFIQRHAEAVNQLHKVTVIHIISDKTCTSKTLFSLQEISGVDTHIAYIKPSINPLIKGLRFYKAFKYILKNTPSFNIVHLHQLFPFGVFALYLKWFQKKKFIISEHWTGYFQPQVQKLSKLQVWFSKLICKKADRICPVSIELQNSMQKIGFNGQFTIVPNVVDTQLFKPITVKSKRFTILHISNMVDEHKNVSGIINVIAQFSEYITDFTLVLIGEHSKKYKALADELGVAKYINFIDHIPHEEVVSHIQKSDVYISFSNYETWGIVMIEALACGVPVISTDTGIINELQLTDFCEIIPKKDEKALLIKLLTIQKSNFDSIEMHNFVKHNFSKEVIAEKFSEIYDKTIILSKTKS